MPLGTGPIAIRVRVDRLRVVGGVEYQLWPVFLFRAIRRKQHNPYIDAAIARCDHMGSQTIKKALIKPREIDLWPAIERCLCSTALVWYGLTPKIVPAP